jgi:hypothetical protein
MASRQAMTDAEWSSCTDPGRMLRFLRLRQGYRKMYLFAVACCRRRWDLLPEASRQCVEVVERYADGLATLDEVEAARAAASEAANWARLGKDAARTYTLALAAVNATNPSPFEAARHAAMFSADRNQPGNDQADLLRDIAGNPFRPVRWKRSWLSWNDGVLPRLAQAAYDERHPESGVLDPTRFAILADALEDAGCTDRTILDHCRSGEHVRGCWLLDLVRSID